MSLTCIEGDEEKTEPVQTDSADSSCFFSGMSVLTLALCAMCYSKLAYNQLLY